MQWHHVGAGGAVDEPCIQVVPSASLAAAIEAMVAGAVSHLAVVRPGSRTPDGVVSEIDLVAAQAR